MSYDRRWKVAFEDPQKAREIDRKIEELGKQIWPLQQKAYSFDRSFAMRIRRDEFKEAAEVYGELARLKAEVMKLQAEGVRYGLNRGPRDDDAYYYEDHSIRDDEYKAQDYRNKALAWRP